jgi:uncharacterized protein YbjT (DUF2867 family)
MESDVIVITTPTGQIGSQVLENLLDTDEDLRVIARDPSSLGADALDRLEVVERSQSDATGVGEAFAGADAAFWLPPPDLRAWSVEAAFVVFTRPAAAVCMKQARSESSPSHRPAVARPGLRMLAMSQARWQWTT